METVKGVTTFNSKSLVSHLKLDFVPKTILIIRQKSLFGGLELYRERSEVHEIAYISFDFNFFAWIFINIEFCICLHVVHFSINELIDRLIHVNIFLCEVLRIHVIHLVKGLLISIDKHMIDVELTLILDAVIEEAWT